MDKTLLNEEVRNKLKLRHLSARRDFESRHSHAKLFFDNVGLDLGKIRYHASKLIAAGGLGSSLLLGSGESVFAKEEPLPLPEPIVQVLTQGGVALPQEPKAWLSTQLKEILPPITDRTALPFLTHEQEKVIGRFITQATKIKAVATLEGEHLNTSYGITGYEQHLQRYPGDTIDQHDEIRLAGIAPGRGAWGWFSVSRGSMTEQEYLYEKYYVAVQTLYLPDWHKRWSYLKDWYKYRKVIVVNPENGVAVVAVVGDSGPAVWTEKHFGGSPETMNALGGPKYRSGRVLLFFVDDVENKVPLGPVDYSKIDVAVVKPI